MITHTGGCHCGRVKFEVVAPEDIVVSKCNCSICQKVGYLALIVHKTRFKLLQGEESLSLYTSIRGIAQHLFCSYCGIKSFYVPRSHPDGYSINVRCLAPSTIKSMTTKTFNGQEWEKQYPKGRAETFPN